MILQFGKLRVIIFTYLQFRYVGVLAKYIMRPVDNTTQFINSKFKQLKWRTPMVGVHIRRTDKVG